MNRQATALLIGLGCAAVADQTACAASLDLFRSSRSVSADEAANGAPAGGVVHDFFVTSDADLLTISPEISASLYQHPYGSSHSQPIPELVARFPALGANSYLRLPGDTIVLGGGFANQGSAWGDLTNDGPQSQFHFGRLTTSQSGTFSGSIAVRGNEVPISLPFTFSLPGAGEGLLTATTERHSLHADEPRPQPPTVPSGPTGPDLNQFTSPEFDGNVAIELTRRSRALTAREVALGAPAGYVHEFFVTSSTDLISIGNVDIDGATYRHERGSDRKPPNERVLRFWPGVSADSFLTTPGMTQVLGRGFYGTDSSEIAWYDESDDGPLDKFLFARLTVSETGSFSGDVNVRGPEGRVRLPFVFALPGTERDLALLEVEQTYRLELAFDGSSADSARQVPEPGSWLLFAIASTLSARRRPSMR